jgi:hypothetical protein
MTDYSQTSPGERAAYANGRESVLQEMDKIANVSLHQRAADWNTIQRLTEALIDIEELVDGYVDIDHNGNPNLAMKIMTVIHAVQGKT